MEIHTLFLATVLLLAHGGRVTGEADVEVTQDECQQPPENTELVTCCEYPTRHILGHIKDTVHFCAKKVKQVRGNEGEPEFSALPPQSARRRHVFRQRLRDGLRDWKLKISKRRREQKKQANKAYNASETCFVECLFEREGFLVDNTISKEAIIERIKNTFMDYEEWQETGSAVVEKCLSSEISVPENETCKSGSAEVFQCINKEMFMQCPFWLEDNEYCNSLKNFYLKCPNGPPPEVFPKKRHNRRNRTKNVESEPEEETENTNEQM